MGLRNLPQDISRGATMSSYTPSLRDKIVYALAGNWFGDTREGVEKARNVSNVLETVTPYGMATMAYDAGRAGGSGDYLGAGLMGAMAALPLPAPVEKKAAQGIRAFHGSPHSFEKFSMDKIGTGEGAQAYGHGLYFAENEGVAKGYRDALANKKTMPGNQASPLKTAWSLVGGHPDRVSMPTDDLLKYVKPAWPDVPDDELRAAIDAAKAQHSPGSMYEVRINANPDDFLDWDKPLSEQPESVRKYWEKMQGTKIGALADKSVHGAISRKEGQFADPTGKDLWGSLSEGLIGYGKPRPYQQVKSEASERLKKSGIPGIKYLDAGSRGKGDGSRNYVVFDDKLIEIVRKYGIAGATALVGYNFMPELTAEQQKQLKMIEG